MGTAKAAEKQRLTAEELKEYAALQEELHSLQKQYGLPEEEEKQTLFVRIGEAYCSFKEKHTVLNTVNRKTYCRLCLLGFVGAHHFYARHWVKGILYAALCWTGISAGFAFIDWMAAVPKKPDGEGNILI